MPFLIPDSYGADYRDSISIYEMLEYNKCHVKKGDPGGQFCDTSGGVPTKAGGGAAKGAKVAKGGKGKAVKKGSSTKGDKNDPLAIGLAKMAKAAQAVKAKAAKVKKAEGEAAPPAKPKKPKKMSADEMMLADLAKSNAKAGKPKGSGFTPSQIEALSQTPAGQETLKSFGIEPVTAAAMIAKGDAAEVKLEAKLPKADGSLKGKAAELKAASDKAKEDGGNAGGPVVRINDHGGPKSPKKSSLEPETDPPASTMTEKISPTEKAAVEHYTRDSRSINTLLRGVRPGHTLTGEEDFKSAERAIPGIDAAIEKAVLGADATVYRGVSALHANSMLPGTVVRDEGYGSTSTALSVAQEFAEGEFYKGPDRKYAGSIMVIKVPKGKRLLDINANAKSRYSNEAEHLLPRGTRYRVISNSNGVIVVEVI